MTYAYNTFDAWLRGHGFASNLDEAGELRDGTAQGFFASQYTAWLTDLLAFYAEAIRARYGLPSDQQFLITLNQNDPTGLPIISGLTAAQIGELFSDTSDFAWGGKGADSPLHVRYYANSFLLPPDHTPVAANVAASDSEDAAPFLLTLTASDTDAGDAIESFTLTSLPPPDAGVLYTDPALSNAAAAGVAHAASGGMLTLYFAPHENFNGEIHFNFTASDGELNSAAATATITLSQQNDPATFAGDVGGSGDEGGGPIAGTLMVSDAADGMTAPSFRIESGDGPSNGAAAIDLVTGQWSYTPNANFNGADHFTVSVTDDDNNVETQVIDITVNDINKFSVSTPVDTDAAADAVDENVALGTVVGVTAFASDDDATNNGVTYSLSADAGGLFAIDPNTGVVTTAAAIDRETLGVSVQIEVTATSQDGSAAAQTFTIVINGLNDNSPVITSNGSGASASINVTENVTAVTTVTATDADLPAQTLSYSIVGGADAARFTVDSSTGVLSFLAAPSFEAPTDAGKNNIYDVIVRASDGTLFDDQTIAVTVADVNEAPVANNDVWVITWNADFTVLGDFWLTNNDSDPDGDPIFVTAVTESGGGIPWLTPTFSGGVLTGLDIANPTISGTFTLTYTLSDGSLTDTATGTLKVVGTGTGPDTITAADLDGSDFTVIDGQDGNDTITGDLFLTGNAGIDTFLGGNGDDTLNGGGGNDFLVGGPGNDVLNGGDGEFDALFGGPGNDTLIGGFGTDNYTYSSSGEGTDTINETGGGGTDQIVITRVNESVERIDLNFERLNADGDFTADDLRITCNDETINVINQYNSGAVELIIFSNGGTAFGHSLGFIYNLSTDATGNLDGGSNADVIASTSAGETLNGNDGDDLLFGNGGNDAMNGGLGSDLLVGGEGADTIDGGSANDWLVGGAGGDSLTGGSDNDTFVYTALSDSQPSAGEFDAIAGFSANTNTTINSGVHTNINGDIIDLTAIDAIPGGTNQAFSFIGTNNFSVAGQLRYFTQNGETIIQGNTDADTATVEFEIHLMGVMILTQDGFNL